MADDKHMMTPEETAQYLRKSLSWVYKNSAVLGARKLGGSLFFPSKENLYEHIFHQKQGVEIRLHSQRSQVHGSLVQNQNRGQTSRGPKKKGDKKSCTESGGTDRHGLLGPCEFTARPC